MRSSFLLAAVLLFASSSSAKTKVVATVPSLAALAAEIGGPHVDVASLAAPTEDPHYVDPRPSAIVLLNQAQLLIVNGLDLEVGWLPKMQIAARNASIQVGGAGYLDASTVVGVLDAPTGKVDRAQGDVHPGGNPHYLFDARRGALVARAIAERLATLDPAHAAETKQRGAQVAAALEAYAVEARASFAALPEQQRRVVTYHKSLSYLIDWLGLQATATIEPKPGIPPDPAHVARVLGAMRAQKVGAILQEEFYPKDTGRKLAELTGARHIVLPGGAKFSSGETYLQHLRRFVEDVHHAVSTH